MDEVLNRNAVTSAASYAVIQFASNAGGAVSIVNTQWLTPRRCEVYWPPIKGSKAFDRILSSVDASPDEKWKLYGVQRVFYETGSLIEAKKKLKLSEFTSDLEIAEETSQKRLTKRTKRYILSESESDDDRHVRPPQVKKKFVNRLSIKDHQDQPTPPTAENIVSNCTINENSSLLNNKDDLPLLSSSVMQGLEHELRQTNSQESLWLEGTPPQKSEQYYGNAKQSSATTCSSTLTGFQSKVLSLLSIIKTQNEQMLELLKRSRDSSRDTKT